MTIQINLSEKMVKTLERATAITLNKETQGTQQYKDTEKAYNLMFELVQNIAEKPKYKNCVCTAACGAGLGHNVMEVK